MIRLFTIAALFALILNSPFAAEESGDYKPDTFAIAAESSELTSTISKLSGISPYFHLYDINGKLIEVLPNPHLDLEYGIGPAAAATLADKGVTVNNLMPGYTRTERLEHLAAHIASQKGVPESEAYAGWETQVPAGRIGEPEEFGALAAFLASEQAAYITGQSIAVDGGWIRSLI